MSRLRDIRYRLEYAGIQLLLNLVCLTPAPIAYWLANRMAWLLSDVIRMRRAVVDQNLQIAFGKTRSKPERDRIARNCYRHFMALAVDLARLMARPPRPINQTIRIADGEERFDQIMSQRPLPIMVTGHLGCWEASTWHIINRYDLNYFALAKPAHNPYVYDLVERLRAQGQGTFQTISTRESLRKIVHHMRKGWLCGIVGDQDARKNGIPVDFMGTPASTATGAAFFAYKMKTSLLPFVYTRVGPQRYELHYCEPIAPPKDADSQTAVYQLTQQYNQTLETYVRRYPEQYWWFHRRWKTQPEHLRKKRTTKTTAAETTTAQP